MSDHDSERSTDRSSHSNNVTGRAEAQELVIIHAQGDLDLVVGHKTLRVWTVILRFASKVFAAMLSPTYAEGQQEFSAVCPGVIPLPEDDPLAMQTICEILHIQFGENTRLSPSEMLNVCAAADKYDCMASVKPTLLIHLPPYLKMVLYEEDLLNLVAAMYLMNDARQFRTWSGWLLENYEERYHGHLAGAAAQFLPTQMSCECSAGCPLEGK